MMNPKRAVKAAVFLAVSLTMFLTGCGTTVEASATATTPPSEVTDKVSQSEPLTVENKQLNTVKICNTRKQSSSDCVVNRDNSYPYRGALREPKNYFNHKMEPRKGNNEKFLNNVVSHPRVLGGV